MFDISWTDPTRETVGERKNRKYRGTNGPSKTPSIGDAGSILSASAKPQFSPLSLFGGNKRSGSNISSSQLQESTSGVDTSVLAFQHGASYTLSSDSATNSPDNITTALITGNKSISGDPYNTCTDQQSPLEASESIFSGHTSRSTDSTWSSVESTTSSTQIIQPLGPRSFVTRSTEVTIAPQENTYTTERGTTTVHISASETSPGEAPHFSTELSYTSLDFDHPVLDLYSPNTKAANIPPNIRPISARSRKADYWQAPDAWHCSLPEEPKIPQPLEISSPGLHDLPFRGNNQTRQDSSLVEVVHLQKNIRRMEAAGDRIILERLKEKWNQSASDVVYQELEFEKQLWMLSALKGFAKTSTKGVDKNANCTGLTKVLSLHESHASASFLTALTMAHEVHHISVSPLSPNTYPKIHPLAVPIATSQLPYAPNTFSSIHAFTLPSLLPASSIPSILKDCHRVLTTQLPISNISSTFTSPLGSTPKLSGTAGTIHLTIIDPSPLSATLGPHLRAWLDEHLLLNLEQQFRCLSPGRLFTRWLTDAGFHTGGGRIKKKCFLACVEESVKQDTERDGFNADTVKLELRSMVGRMMWKEMWGPFVDGKQMWWEDEKVVNECEYMGTCWEYTIIDAVKG